MHVGNDRVRQLRRVLRVGTQVDTILGTGTVAIRPDASRANRGPVCADNGFATIVVKLDNPRPCQNCTGGHVDLDPDTFFCRYCEHPTELLEPDQVSTK